MYKRHKRNNIQSHYLLAERLDDMVRAIQGNRFVALSEEEQKAINDFRNAAADHRQKAWMTGDTFIMIS